MVSVSSTYDHFNISNTVLNHNLGSDEWNSGPEISTRKQKQGSSWLTMVNHLTWLSRSSFCLTSLQIPQFVPAFNGTSFDTMFTY